MERILRTTFPAVLLVLFMGSALAAPKKSRPAPDMANFGLPKLMVCDGEEGLFRYDWRTKTREPILEGIDAHDVEPQADGSYLVAGAGFVGLVRKEDGAYRLAWDWGRLNLPCVVNAVAADREWGGGPSLVLASDCTLNRLVLAEAKTDDPKIRWEFKLPGTPQRVSLCRDSGNFLVTIRIHSLGFGEAPQVAEVFFREDRIGWSLNSKDGVLNAQDAVRDAKGRTMVVMGGKKPEVRCYNLKKEPQWERKLTATKDATYTLCLFTVKGRERLLVCARPKGTSHAVGKKKPSRPKGPFGLYLLDSANGKQLAFTKDPSTQGAAPLNIVMDRAPSKKKSKR